MFHFSTEVPAANGVHQTSRPRHRYNGSYVERYMGLSSARTGQAGLYGTMASIEFRGGGEVTIEATHPRGRR